MTTFFVSVSFRSYKQLLNLSFESGSLPGKFLEMYHCYILYSTSSGKLYIGQTNDLQDRLRRHNEGYNLATRNKGPW